MSEKLAAALESMRGQFPANWDSYGARAVDDKAIDLALQLVDKAEAMGLTRIEPTADGGICFSDNDESVWLKIELDSFKIQEAK